MTSQVVNLQVTASVPIDCGFWSEDDGWKGLCQSLMVTVSGSSFEDAKKNMATDYSSGTARVPRVGESADKQYAWPPFIQDKNRMR
jgi:hypothetical protein